MRTYLEKIKFYTVTKLRAFLIFAALLTCVLYAAEYVYRFGHGPGVTPPPIHESEEHEHEDEHALAEDDDATEEEVTSVAPQKATEQEVVGAKPVRRRGPNKSIEPSKVQLSTIREIEFSGVTAFSPQELQKVVKEFIGQELSVQEAFDIPAKISQYYSSHNLVARANLVGSLDRDGVLRIGVIETEMKQQQVDKVLATMAPAPTPQLAAKSAVAAVEPVAPASPATPQTPQTPQTPTAAPAPAPVATSAPAPAPAPASAPAPVPTGDAETDYILKRYANTSRQFEVIVDNFGYEATGSNRAGLSMRTSSVMSPDDELYVLGVKSSGSDNLGFGYRFKTGIQGLSVGLKLSKLSYEVVSGVQSALYVSGDAVKKGVELVFDLVKAPDHTSSLVLAVDSKDFHNAPGQAAYSNDYNSHVASLQWKGVVRELEPGGAVMSYDSLFSRGSVDMSDSASRLADANGAQTDGDFTKWRFGGSILQPISGLTALYAGLSMQRSNKYLDSSERFYLGGPYGVRAYGWGEGVGSVGEMLKLEVRQKLDASTTLTGFYDWGQVRSMHAANNMDVASVDSVMLKGYGMSLGYEIDRQTSIKGTWARRQGSSPDPLHAPSNSDGEFDRNRFWLTMETRF